MLWLLVGLIALLLVGYLAYRFLFNRGGDIVADNPTAVAATTVAGAGTGQDGTPLPTAEGQPGSTDGMMGQPHHADHGAFETTGITPTAVLTDTAGAPTVPPPAAQGPIPAPVANPNAQPVSLGTQLDANGWVYTYPDASYVLVRGKQIGSFTAQGSYLHILVWVGNIHWHRAADPGRLSPPRGFASKRSSRHCASTSSARSCPRRRASTAMSARCADSGACFAKPLSVVARLRQLEAAKRADVVWLQRPMTEYFLDDARAVRRAQHADGVRLRRRDLPQPVGTQDQDPPHHRGREPRRRRQQLPRRVRRRAEKLTVIPTVVDEKRYAARRSRGSVHDRVDRHVAQLEGARAVRPALRRVLAGDGRPAADRCPKR